MKVKYVFLVFWAIFALLFSACDLFNENDNSGNGTEKDDGNQNGVKIIPEQSLVTAGNPRRISIYTNYNVINSVDNGREYLTYAGNNLNPVFATLVNSDGSVSVCSPVKDSKDVYVYEYTNNLVFVSAMKFKMEFDMFGAFTKDDEGNYYFFSGKQVKEEGERHVENMALIKYNKQGKKLNTYRLIAGSDGLGIINPFRSGSCRMEISGNMLCVYFGKAGGGHQSTFGFIVNKNTIQPMDIKIPYSSHSFNQFILPVDGGFVIVNKGDYHPERAFTFSLVGNRTILNKWGFKFPGSINDTGYNYVFSQLGGLAKTSGGYIFAGTYEKTASASNLAHTDSRNVFVLTFDNELNNFSEPIWITNYNDRVNENAVSPKITALNGGRYLIMWELLGIDRAAYMAIVDEMGNTLVPVTKVSDIYLNVSDALRYCEENGNVYWAVNYGTREINIYAFNPDMPINYDTNIGKIPGGGHGMRLIDFNVYGITAVKRNVAFNIRPAIRTIHAEGTFPGGQVGVALTDIYGNAITDIDGNLLIIGINNYREQGPGITLAAVGDISSVIPDTVNPGSYKLVIVIRPTGGEWRAITLASNDIPTSIDLEVE